MMVTRGGSKGSPLLLSLRAMSILAEQHGMLGEKLSHGIADTASKRESSIAHGAAERLLGAALPAWRPG